MKLSNRTLDRLIPNFLKIIYLMVKYRCYISLSTKIVDVGKIQIGQKSIIKASVLNGTGDGINIDTDVYIHENSLIHANGGSIKIGKNTTINFACVLYGEGGIEIGDNCAIATGTTIVSSNHNYNDVTKNIIDQGITRKGVLIKNDVWIGSKVNILDGVVLENGTIIGAGSVVTKSTQPNSINFGIPASFKYFRGTK